MNSSEKPNDFILSPERKRFYLIRREDDSQDLKTALLENNYLRICDIGHRIKGSARLFGFLELEVLAKQLELAAAVENVEELTVLVHEFETRVLEFLSALPVASEE